MSLPIHDSLWRSALMWQPQQLRRAEHKILILVLAKPFVALRLNGKHGCDGVFTPECGMYCPRNSVCMGSAEPACLLCHWSFHALGRP